MTSTTSTWTGTFRSADDRQPGALTLTGVSKSYGGSGRRAVEEFTLDVEPGTFVTLLGPSGCGKTTTLRMIAGFETPTEGDILVDDKSIVSVPPNRRPMSMVFQSYALFPHLSVTDNVGFGLTAKHAAKAQRRERVAQALDLMGIEEYAQRYPHELSGGQQQRVALARALVMEPSILLFDEPLSNLDARLRVRMREEIRAIQQRLKITSVFVTHDQSEAMTMSDLVVVMREGRIEQVGTPEEAYHRPATEFVASFLGTANFVPTNLRPDGPGRAMIRSENLHVVAAGRSSGDAIAGTVHSAAFDGAVARYTVDTPLGRLSAQAPGDEPLIDVGTAVRCEYRADDLWTMDV
jgi:iron(III) transport system ATP-binding protein